MAKTVSFFEQYVDGDKTLLAISPKLAVKFRNELCFKGRKIAYEDFPKIVRHEDNIVPLVCYPKPVADDDIVIDVGALLSAGIAEVITMLNVERQTVAFDYIAYLAESEITKDWWDMLSKAGDMKDRAIDDCMPGMLTETLRSSLIDYRFPLVRRIYSTLEALRMLNPKSWCEAIIEGMRCSVTVCSMFMCDGCDVSASMQSGASSTQSQVMYGNIVTQRLSRIGAIEYNVDGTDRVRRISDGRGLSLCMLTLFVLDVYNRYADFKGVVEAVPFKLPKSRRYALKAFESCLGDDFVGRYLLKGYCRITPCDSRMVNIANEANLMPVDCGMAFKNDGHGVERLGRGFKEAQILWKYACGIKDIDTAGVYDPVDCTYGTRTDIVHACIDFCFSERGMKMSKEITAEYESQLVDYAMQRMDMDSVIASIRKDVMEDATKRLADVERELASSLETIAGLTRQRESYEHALASKQDIIDKLRAEVDSLNARVRSTFADEDFADENGVVENPVTQEEMLEFVNQFRLVVIGGQDRIKTKLEAAGFTNFYCIDSEHASNTLVSGDFFCICAKFVSHKSIYMVESRYPTQLDEFFYFNGTNVNAMLRTCYEFMHGYLAGSGGVNSGK